jgi:hypothetical protein
MFIICTHSSPCPYIPHAPVPPCACFRVFHVYAIPRISCVCHTSYFMAHVPMVHAPILGSYLPRPPLLNPLSLPAFPCCSPLVLPFYVLIRSERLGFTGQIRWSRLQEPTNRVQHTRGHRVTGCTHRVILELTEKMKRPIRLSPAIIPLRCLSGLDPFGGCFRRRCLSTKIGR